MGHNFVYSLKMHPDVPVALAEPEAPADLLSPQPPIRQWVFGGCYIYKGAPSAKYPRPVPIGSAWLRVACSSPGFLFYPNHPPSGS